MQNNKKLFFLIIFFSVFLFLGGEILAAKCYLPPSWNTTGNCTVDIEYRDPSGGSNLSQCFYAITGNASLNCSSNNNWVQACNCTGETTTCSNISVSVGSAGICSADGQGACKICVKAVDGAGNTGYGERALNIDLRPPSVLVAGASSNWNYIDARAEISCTDSGSGCNAASSKIKTYDFNPVSCPADYNSYSLSSPQNITSHLWACGAAKDNVGNAGFSASPVEFKIDKIRPTSRIISPPTGSTQISNFSVIVEDIDAGESGLDKCYYNVAAAYVGYTKNGAERNCYSSVQITVGPMGSGADCLMNTTCLVYVYSRDKAGNTSDYNMRSFIIRQTSVDTTPPAVSVTGAPLSWQNTDAEANVSCQDNTGGSGCNTQSYLLRTYNQNPVSCPTAYGDYPSPSPYNISSNYWLCGAAKDNVGNTGFSASPIEFKIDKVNPQVASFDVQPRALNIQSPSAAISWNISDYGGSHLKQVETWRAFDSDNDGVIDSGEWGTNPINTYTGPFDTPDSDTGSYQNTPAADGTYWYGLHVFDIAGNMTTESAPIKVTVDKTIPPPVDTTPPAVSVTGAPLSWQNTDASAVVSCQDNTGGSGCNTQSYKLKTYDSNPNSCPNNPADYANYDLISPQIIFSHKWVCGTAKDLASPANTGFSTPPLEFKVDKTVPQIFSFDVQPRILNPQSPSATVSWNVSDSGGSHLNYTNIWRANYNSSDCSDANKSGCVWSQIGSNHSAPADSDGPWSSSSTDSPSGGAFWYGIHVLDKAGNINYESSPIKVTYANNPPQISSVAYTSSPCDSPTTQSDCNVNFTILATDPDGDVLSYLWDFGDGKNSSIQNPSHYYSGANTFTVIATASDGKGGTASRGLTLSVANPTLSVDLIADPSSGNAPLSNVDLKATVSGTMTGAINYKFDCNNDGTWEGEINNKNDNSYNFEHCNYLTVGNYLAKVLIEKGDGCEGKECTGIENCCQIRKISVSVRTPEPPPQTECNSDNDCSGNSSSCGYKGSCNCGIYEKPIWSCSNKKCVCSCRYDSSCSGPGACQKNLPEIYLDPSSQTGLKNQESTFKVSIINNHQNCNEAPFSLIKSCPSGWTCSLVTANLNISSGRSTATYLKVTPSASASRGNYNVSVTASTPGSVLEGTGSAVLKIGNYPPTASFSCHPQGCDGSSGSCTGYAQSNFCFKNNSTDPDGQGDIQKSVWDVLGWGSSPDITCFPPNALCNFTIPPTLSAGNYSLQLGVFDKEGASDFTAKPITVSQDILPEFKCSLSPNPSAWQVCGQECDQGCETNCKGGSSFRTSQGEKVYFKDFSAPSQGATLNSWSWTFMSGEPSESNDRNPPSVTFFKTGQNPGCVTLTVTDTAGRTKSKTYQIRVTLPLPEWKEVAPE